MPYTTTITNESAFEQQSQGRRNFNELYQDPNWTSSASSWGIAELYASRALCMSEKDIITPLSKFYTPFDRDTLNSHLKSFVDGFTNMADLAWLSEPQLVRASKYESLGIIWAAVGNFLRKEQFAMNIYGPSRPLRLQPLLRPQPIASSSRPTRQAAAVAHANIQALSVAGTRHGEGPALRSAGSTSPSLSAASNSSGSLLGYDESLAAPLVEDATVHLVGSTIRYLLNFMQPPSKPRPLTWRDEKTMYRYKRGENQDDIVAADDGGLQIWAVGSRNFRQIALVEAKRALKIANGTFETDEVLAQMVAQAIGLQRMDQASTYVAAIQNVSIGILATNRFLRFYAFEFLTNYLANYENWAMGTRGCHLRIRQTKRLDLTRQSHREGLVVHLSAILKWADSILENPEMANA
ncbi:hypothetical protein ACHAPV_002846 [Trichoderma viride]